MDHCVEAVMAATRDTTDAIKTYVWLKGDWRCAWWSEITTRSPSLRVYLSLIDHSVALTTSCSLHPIHAVASHAC